MVDEPTLRKAFQEVAPQVEEQMLSIAAQRWLKQGHDQGEREGLAKVLLRQLEPTRGP